MPLHVLLPEEGQTILATSPTNFVDRYRRHAFRPSWSTTSYMREAAARAANLGVTIRCDTPLHFLLDLHRVGYVRIVSPEDPESLWEWPNG